MTDGPALGLANTLLRSADLLRSPGGLATWLATWAPTAGTATDGVLLRLGDFRDLREAVRSAFTRAVERRAIPADAVRDLNAASALAPTWFVLDADGVGVATVRAETSSASETTQILASIARSAIELLGGPHRVRLRTCAQCGRFFLGSRRGQVWCSAACGNRARVARHRARRTVPPGSALG
jgi:predicted RNA-binding Zn ribbon-like protein